MAIARTLVVLALALTTASSAISQVLTGFGSSEVNPLNLPGDFVFNWSGTQNATTVSVVNVSNGSGGIFQSLSAPVFIDQQPALALTGTAQAIPGGVTLFTIVLFDAGNNELTATFDWAAFSGGATVLANLTGDAEFDGTVTSWQLVLFGSPAEDVSFTFDELAAVPEPATVAFLAGAGGVMLLLRRRRGARL